MQAIHSYPIERSRVFTSNSMRVSFAATIFALFAFVALSEGVSTRSTTRRADTFLEVHARGKIENGVIKMNQKMLTPCGPKCIQSVLNEAKHFHAGAVSKGDCMYTTIEGNSEPYLDAEGNERLTEDECDEADGDWVENLKGGPVDILLNAFKAFNARDGGVVKMFFTVVTQGFYLVKDRLVTSLGLHVKMRTVWAEIRNSASPNLGDYSIRTEKKSLYDMARRQIQTLLSDPIGNVCGVLPSVQMGFMGNGVSISMSELCASAIASIINNYMGWMKKQIKNMIKKIFKEKGSIEMGKQIVQTLTAPVGYVYKKFEDGLSQKLDPLFGKIRGILRDLQVAKVNHRNAMIQNVARGYCWDDMNKEMFNGDDKEDEARQQYAADLRKIKYRTIPTLDGLDSAIEESYVLYEGYKQDKTIIDKMERLVYATSLIFDPRVANVWTSDMLDALITSVMTKFSTAMVSKKRGENMLATAKKATGHMSGNSLTQRKTFNDTMNAIKNNIHVTIEELEANHEREVEIQKADCWKDVKGARCYSLYHKLREARANDNRNATEGRGVLGWLRGKGKGNENEEQKDEEHKDEVAFLQLGASTRKTALKRNKLQVLWGEKERRGFR